MLRRGVHYTPWEMCVPVGRFLLGGFRLVIGGKRYQAVVPPKNSGVPSPPVTLSFRTLGAIDSASGWNFCEGQLSDS